jgi:hypothetical protein
MTRARDLADSADKDIAGTLTLDDITLSNDITLADNGKAIFGAGSDLTISHDTTGTVGSYITEAGTGSLNIRGQNIIFANADGSEEYGKFFNGAGVEFNYADATKFATTSTGVDITGTAVTDGVTVAGNLSVDGGTIKLDGNYPTGAQNVALGDSALSSVSSTGNYNTAVGNRALRDSTDGDQNTAVGRDALLLNTTGSNNTAIGMNTLNANTTGGSNTAIGRSALEANTTASSNTAVGYQAGYANTTGHSNTYIGRQAGLSNTTNSYSTYLGYVAGENTTGEKNTFLGQGAGSSVTTGADNTILGRYNGNQGGLDIRTSSNNIVLSDGDGNPRLYLNSSGNAFLGTTSSLFSGSHMLEIYTSNASGDSGIVIKHRDATGITNVNAQLFVNNAGSAVGSIKMNSSSTSYNTSSDHRLKENVVELTGATDRLKQLKPSRFNFIADADTTVDGFLAHEVQSVVPEAIHGTHNEVDGDGNPVYQGIDQSKLVPLLVATIKELEARITALENA